jgi:hypothetical protein
MKRCASKKDKKLADDARLLRAWRNWHREELNAALVGLHGPMIERLVFILKTLAPDSASLLLAYVRGVDWQLIDYPTRLVVLHEVNTAITRLRERNSLDGISDPLPGQPESAFRLIKAILSNDKPSHPTVAPPGAQPGLVNSTHDTMEKSS